MANLIGRNPWVIDTASNDPIWRGVLYVDHFEMIGYSADAHEIVVKDQDGNTIWHGNGNGDLSPVVSESIGWLQHGLLIDSLPSGAKLLVFQGS